MQITTFAISFLYGFYNFAQINALPHSDLNVTRAEGSDPRNLTKEEDLWQWHYWMSDFVKAHENTNFLPPGSQSTVHLTSLNRVVLSPNIRGAGSIDADGMFPSQIRFLSRDSVTPQKNAIDLTLSLNTYHSSLDIVGSHEVDPRPNIQPLTWLESEPYADFAMAVEQLRWDGDPDILVEAWLDTAEPTRPGRHSWKITTESVLGIRLTSQVYLDDGEVAPYELLDGNIPAANITTLSSATS